MSNRNSFSARAAWFACAIWLMSIGCAYAADPIINKKEQAPPAANGVALMSTSLPSSDLDRSIAFYTKGLGMTVAGRMEMGSVVEVPINFPGGGANLILQHPKSDGTPLPVRGALSRIILIVPDLKALAVQLNAAGYALTGKINEMPQYKVAVAQLEDPDGNHLELVQRTQ